MSYADAVKVWKEGNFKDLDKFFVKFTYCSLKIENDQTRLIDVETIFNEDKVIDFIDDKKVIIEIENHKKLCKNMLQLCNSNNTKLSIDLIKQVHYAIMKNCYSESLLLKDERPGEFRKRMCALELHDATTDSLDIEENVNLLVSELDNTEINSDNALKVVGYFLCSFEKISPFAAGNGIVGRMLINYMLIGNNLPPIIFFYTDKEEYYLALDSFDSTNDLNKMITFLTDQTYKTWIKDYNVKLKSLKYFLDYKI